MCVLFGGEVLAWLIIAILSVSSLAGLSWLTLAMIRRWRISGGYRHFIGPRLPGELALAKSYILNRPALLIMCLGGGLLGGLLGFGGSPAGKPNTQPGGLERLRRWYRPSPPQNGHGIAKKLAGALPLGLARRAKLRMALLRSRYMPCPKRTTHSSKERFLEANRSSRYSSSSAESRSTSVGFFSFKEECFPFRGIL